jgi:hypothetical protein
MAMKKRTAVAVTVGVWLAALGSAAALTYNANRPEHIAARGGQADEPSDTADADPAASIPEPEAVVCMPYVTIVGKTQRALASARGPTQSVDSAEMQCARLRTQRSSHLGLVSMPPPWLAGRVLGEDESMPTGTCSHGPRECSDWRDIDIGFGNVQMCP